MSLQNVLYATGPGDEQAFSARRVSTAAALVRGERKVGQLTTTELALVGIGGDETTGLPIETDARLFHVSANRVAFSDGTFLKWRGTNLVDGAKPDDVETDVPPTLRGDLEKDLQRLWQSVHVQPQPPVEFAKDVTLKTEWTFQGFDDHAKPVMPTGVERTPESESWTGRFEQPQDLESVVIVADDGLDPQQVVVEFSNDGFQSDVRAATTPPQRSARIVGPYGKSFFRTETLLTVPGQRARHVRVTVGQLKPGTKPPIKDVELFAKEREPAAITRLRVADLDRDQRPEVLALTRDNQLGVLQHDGRVRWRRSFDHNVLALEILDVDDDDRQEILVCEANRDLQIIRPDGSAAKTIVLRTSDSIYEDFFRSNRAYTMGLWRPRSGQPPNLILGTYQSVPWITPKDQIVSWPPDSDEKPYRSGYVWRGLIYWEKTLPEGLDFNGDGVQDQAFIGRGWATEPSVMFFDGARHDALAEYVIPSSRPLGLEVVRLGETRLVLAATELHLGLYSTDGAKELWRIRFDTPAVDYDFVSDDEGYRIAVAKGDGVVLTIDFNGKVIGRQLLPPALSTVAHIRIHDKPHLLVGSGGGVTVLSKNLEPVGFCPTPAVNLAKLAPDTALAATPTGALVALTGHGR